MVLAASLFLIIYYGLDLSIDFTGGSVLEVRFEKGDPGKAGVEQVTGSIENSSFTVRPLENGGYSIRSQSLGEKERTLILEKLNLEKEASVREEKFSSIGPTIGRELKRKAFYALLITLLAIVLYIAFAFRKVSKPVSSWIYGLTAIIALAHDITIPTGLFALLGVTGGAQIDVLFIIALLTILGYSINDTIIVFDRVRENLTINQEKNLKEPFGETVGKSLNQTFGRSINTSLTTLFALLALYFFGGEVTRNFSLVLIAGIIAGSYSSIFLACPLLVWVEEKLSRKPKIP